MKQEQNERIKRIEWVNLVVDVALPYAVIFAGFIASMLVFIKARSLRSRTSRILYRTPHLQPDDLQHLSNCISQGPPPVTEIHHDLRTVRTHWNFVERGAAPSEARRIFNEGRAKRVKRTKRIGWNNVSLVVDGAIMSVAISRTSSRECSSSKRLSRFARSPAQNIRGEGFDYRVGIIVEVADRVGHVGQPHFRCF